MKYKVGDLVKVKYVDKFYITRIVAIKYYSDTTSTKAIAVLLNNGFEWKSYLTLNVCTSIKLQNNVMWFWPEYVYKYE